MNNTLFQEPPVPTRDGFAHDIDRENGKEEWLTPPIIIKTFGPFDLDPCAPIKRPWPTASKHFTIEDNGLLKPWEGFVFCNPPYGAKTGDWLKRCAEHNNCLVLIFARTETEAFQKWVWPRAKSLFFIKGRLSFFHVTGKMGGIRRSIRARSLRRTRRPHAARQRQNCGTLHRQQTSRIHRTMTSAIYIRREDGDYDFVAAFAINKLPDAPAPLSQWPDEVAEYFREEGEEVLVVNNCDLQYLPDVWDGTARNLRRFRAKQLKHEKNERRFVAIKEVNP